MGGATSDADVEVEPWNGNAIGQGWNLVVPIPIRNSICVDGVRGSSGQSCGGNCFGQVIVWYTKKDYQDMPEWKLDRLLSEYGLCASGDLAYKRQFAMGAFLWPDHHHEFST
ncbi:hypothetical protein JRO89_XS14G0073800 [Xanthoceras sorbifolium]|uniref:DUF7722 domain-containing protein n=1 Tax=Xanthoceras sorbifolium TaxID=99658 RepID=A0ABQ8H4C4_9ROSI|nr:hypothetical protein JRO89_XS14G0073800 [Xanthoceras sorbifolium]